MPDCAICGKPIPAADKSREHIIPNAIGGRLKRRGITCSPCNSKSGETWDAELARLLNPISLLLGIKRERGQPAPQVFPMVSGGLRRINSNGTSTVGGTSFQTEATEGGFKITGHAPTMSEARRMIEGISRKYPQLDMAALEAGLREERSYDSTPIKVDLQVPAGPAGRSLVKSALCMAVCSGADPATCIPPLSYFDGDNSNPPFGYYYRRPLIRDRSHLSVFHCVAVSSNRASSQLLGYVEYYGLWRAVVLLSDAYEGPDIHACYAVNPLNGEKVQLEFVLDLARDEHDATLRGEPIPADALQDALNTVMPIVQTRSHEREQDRVIDDAVRYALANSGLKWGDNITPAYVPTISNLFAQRVMPFLQHIGWDWRKAAAAQRGNRK